MTVKFNFKYLKCQQREHFTNLMTLIKRSLNKKFIIYCNGKKVIDFFVDMLDYLKINSTVDYDEFLNENTKICFVDKTFSLDNKEIITDYLIFFDLPLEKIIDDLLLLANSSTCNISVIFLVRDCEEKWVESHLISKLKAKEITLPRSQLIDIETPMKVGTKKMFALQRDAQLAYKSFISEYATSCCGNLSDLKLKEIANNFGLDIPPKINGFENLSNKPIQSESESSTDIKIAPEVPRKLRKIR